MWGSVTVERVLLSGSVWNWWVPNEFSRTWNRTEDVGFWNLTTYVSMSSITTNSIMNNSLQKCSCPLYSCRYFNCIDFLLKSCMIHFTIWFDQLLDLGAFLIAYFSCWEIWICWDLIVAENIGKMSHELSCTHFTGTDVDMVVFLFSDMRELNCHTCTCLLSDIFNDLTCMDPVLMLIWLFFNCSLFCPTRPYDY